MARRDTKIHRARFYCQGDFCNTCSQCSVIFFRNMDLQYATKSVHSEKTASSSCQWAFKWHLLPTWSLPISNRLRSDLVIVIMCFFIRRLGTNVTGSFLCYYSNGICFSLKEIYKHIFKSSMLLRNVSLSKGCSSWCVPFKKSEKKNPKHKQTNFKQVWVILEKWIRENNSVRQGLYASRP